MTATETQPGVGFSSLVRHRRPMNTPNERIDRIARMMAAAYWRGRLHGVADGAVLERMIAAAAENDIPHWRASASYADTDDVPPNAPGERRRADDVGLA